MTLILRGRRFGIKLEEIRQWLQIYENEGTQAQREAFIEMADRQLVELEDQAKQLSEAISELRKLREDTAGKLE